MGNLILICLVCVAFYIIKTQHIKVKIKTFFKKGFAPNRGQFGVYCFCGKQGQGKTYSVVEFLKENRLEYDQKIYNLILERHEKFISINDVENANLYWKYKTI